LLEPLRDLADSNLLGPSTACIVAAATERRIPSTRLNDGNLVQLGYGARQRRIWTAETDQTSAIAEGIASDKVLTKSMIAACGVPTPEGRRVDSPEDAWEAAQDIGMPVVVKPADANHGRGVYVDLSSESEIKVSYKRALLHSDDIIVERCLRGNEHRLLVVGRNVVAAARGESAWVTGDGKATISELVEHQINSDPRRGATEDFPLNLVEFTPDTALCYDLARRGHTPDSIPAAGERVLIQRNGNVAFECTDAVHPDVAAQVTLAARIVGLDVAGIDLVVEDISRPLEEQGGAIVEINAGPGLLMHLEPAEGKARPVGEAIIESLFPAGESGRIPIIGIAGARGMTLVARLIAHIVQLSGHHVGLACSDGLFFDRRRVDTNNCATWQAAHRVLMNRAVETAVFENGCDMILREGLAYDRCQVGVVLDGGDAAGLEEFDIRDAEQVYDVLRTQVDVILSTGVAVLNADDASVVRMAELCDGDVIFFGASETVPVIAEHRAHGKRALFFRDAHVILANGGEEIALTHRASIPWAESMRIENILAAIGAVWALDISIELIRAGIETFEADCATPPLQSLRRKARSNEAPRTKTTG